jgi:hypothetical protein
MRQASWIVFLLMTLGLLTYEAASDRSSVSSQSAPEGGQQLEGDMPPPGSGPKP